MNKEKLLNLFKKDIPKMFIRTEYVHYPLTFQEQYNRYMNQISDNIALAVKPLMKFRQFESYKKALTDKNIREGKCCCAQDGGSTRGASFRCPVHGRPGHIKWVTKKELEKMYPPRENE